MTFFARLQTHQAKILSAVSKQNLTAKEKQAQIDLIESMAHNNLITGLELKICQVIRARDILTAVWRMKRELQLHNLGSKEIK